MQNTLFPLNVSEVECINLAGRAEVAGEHSPHGAAGAGDWCRKFFAVAGPLPPLVISD